MADENKTDNGYGEKRAFRMSNFTQDGKGGCAGNIEVRDAPVLHFAKRYARKFVQWLIGAGMLSLGGILVFIVRCNRVLSAPEQISRICIAESIHNAKHSITEDSIAEALKIHELEQYYELQSIHRDIIQIGRAVGAKGLSLDTDPAASPDSQKP